MGVYPLILYASSPTYPCPLPKYSSSMALHTSSVQLPLGVPIWLKTDPPRQTITSNLYRVPGVDLRVRYFGSRRKPQTDPSCFLDLSMFFLVLRLAMRTREH